MLSGTFRIPAELLRTDVKPRRVLVVGSCLSQQLLHQFELLAPADYVLFNNVGQLPERPPEPIEAYDFQVVQIPIRTVLPEAAYFRLAYTIEAYDALFRECEERLLQMVDAIMGWNARHGILTFACNFLRPQQNQHGRMLPLHDHRNLQRVFDRLNESLSRAIASYRNAYILDCDEIVASFGRRYFQDDVMIHSNHGGSLGEDIDPSDGERLHRPGRIDQSYPNQRGLILGAIAEEAIAMFRTARGTDAVKLVIVDLDDTLWRGVVVENWRGIGHATEGYPLGLAEALLALKARGILLAIVSKNDAAKVEAVFAHVWHNRLSLDDFVVRRIDWNHKIDNVGEVIRAVNVRPDSVVFIDDNPIEREAVKAAYPEVRVMGQEPYLIRRILLWSPETQVPLISAESSKRTTMVHAQIEREDMRAKMSKEEFLANLHVETEAFVITSTTDPRFARALELLNKTNQFNTTGQRWTFAECQAAFTGGTFFYAVDVRDKYTHYGLVALGVCRDAEILQYVMSCRVLGLGVETSAIEGMIALLEANGAPTVTARLRQTPANHLCNDLYEKQGFYEEAGAWIRSSLDEAPPQGMSGARP